MYPNLLTYYRRCYARDLILKCDSFACKSSCLTHPTFKVSSKLKYVNFFPYRNGFTDRNYSIEKLQKLVKACDKKNQTDGKETTKQYSNNHSKKKICIKAHKGVYSDFREEITHASGI